uniref:Uncharacterized protein n=1 Tax=Anguilla anguilla TaxID=7936 RepID=A0A0E9T1B9_ANGAN
MFDSSSAYMYTDHYFKNLGSRRHKQRARVHFTAVIFHFIGIPNGSNHEMKIYVYELISRS